MGNDGKCIPELSEEDSDKIRLIYDDISLVAQNCYDFIYDSLREKVLTCHPKHNKSNDKNRIDTSTLDRHIISDVISLICAAFIIDDSVNNDINIRNLLENYVETISAYIYKPSLNINYNNKYKVPSTSYKEYTVKISEDNIPYMSD